MKIKYLIMIAFFGFSTVHANEQEAKNIQKYNEESYQVDDLTVITECDIIAAQRQWGNSIVAIGKAYSDGQDYKAVAQDVLNNLYAFNTNTGVVLFRPTLASETPFRGDIESALSYFIGGNDKFQENQGFALKPWVSVEFKNDSIYFGGDFAVVMGQYTFESASGEKVLVDYSFVYRKIETGQLIIVLQHSSLPYKP